MVSVTSAPSSTFISVLTWAGVNAIGAPALPALLPNIVVSAIFASFANVTPLSLILSASELSSIVESSTPTANEIVPLLPVLVVNEPPPDKPLPAVTVIVEFWTPPNADTCADDDTIPAPNALIPAASVTSAPSSKFNAVNIAALSKPSTLVPLILKKSSSSIVASATKTFVSEIPLANAFTNARFVTSESINAPALVTLVVSVTSAPLSTFINVLRFAAVNALGAAAPPETLPKTVSSAMFAIFASVIPLFFTLMVLAAAPLYVVPEFSWIVESSTVRLFPTDVAVPVTLPTKFPLNPADADTLSKSALDPETMTFFHVAIFFLLLIY